jgi:RHS repeat-associated protein
MTGQDGTRTEFGYDNTLRLVSVTRAGLTWRCTRDAAGRLVAGTDCHGVTTRYSYDQAGQLTSRVNAVGQQVSYSYDELGRLAAREAGIPAELVSPDGALWDPGSAATPPRFPGPCHGQETGLPHYQQRYYDPVTTGHFSPDRLGPELAQNPHANLARPYIQADLAGLNAWASAAPAPDFVTCISGPGHGIGSPAQVGYPAGTG